MRGIRQSVSDVLDSAAEYMEGRSLLQGDYYEYAGSRRKHNSACCARGAIHAVTGSEYLAEQATEWASEFVGEYIDDFNDEPGRSKDEVCEALRGAAEFYRISLKPEDHLEIVASRDRDAEWHTVAEEGEWQ